MKQETLLALMLLLLTNTAHADTIILHGGELSHDQTLRLPLHDLALQKNYAIKCVISSFAPESEPIMDFYVILKCGSIQTPTLNGAPFQWSHSTLLQHADNILEIPNLNNCDHGNYLVFHNINEHHNYRVRYCEAVEKDSHT